MCIAAAGTRLGAVGAALLAALLAWGCADRAALATPRHLVLLTLDTLRSDRLGAYGYRRAISPNLDRLAAKGVRFDDAISQSVSTPPSHASMMTGLNPPSHGLRSITGQGLAPENHTLAEVLREAGFVTAAFVSGSPLRRQVGLDQGFDFYDDKPERFGRPAQRTNQRVLAWLKQRPAGRLFLWVHYFDPHNPYFPPEEFRSRFGADGVPFASLWGPYNASDPDEHRPRPKPAFVRNMIDLYDAEVSYLDAAVGTLLSALENEGILGEAIVAVVADHGEHLGEYGYFFGHFDVLEETAQVPMILVHPSGSWADSVVSTPVATIDLMPTLLRWLGVDAALPCEGRDLTPLLEGKDVEERPIYTEQMEYFGVRAMRSENHLLVSRKGPRTASADLPDGFYERRRTGRYALAAASDPEIEERLRRSLRATEEEGLGRAALRLQVPEEVARRLRALGYTAEAER